MAGGQGEWEGLIVLLATRKLCWIVPVCLLTLPWPEQAINGQRFPENTNVSHKKVRDEQWIWAVLQSKQVCKENLYDWGIGVHRLVISYYNVNRSIYQERIKEEKKENIFTAHRVQKTVFWVEGKVQGKKKRQLFKLLKLQMSYTPPAFQSSLSLLIFSLWQSLRKCLYLVDLKLLMLSQMLYI